jgi:iron complex outermembrane receptor protein
MKKLFTLSLNKHQAVFVYFLLVCQLIQAQPVAIKGRIITHDLRPAYSVNVEIKETKKFTTSNEDGYFEFKNVTPGTYTIMVSFVGLVTQQKILEVGAKNVAGIDFTLTENEKELTEVIITTTKGNNKKPVTIGKISINPMDLPQSITVVGQSTIKDQQALRLSDVIRNVNGVYLTTTRGGVQESFAARGYNFSSTNLFKDGFRINSAVMPEISSLEKVEVLKGSAAILYGQVAPGGILNMVTKQPKFQFGGEVLLMAGSYDFYKPSFDVFGPLTSSVAYRVNGTFETENSFRNNISSKRYYVNPSFLFKLGKHTELLIEGDYLKHRFTPDFGIGTIDTTKIPDLPRSKFLGPLWSYNTTQQSTSTVTLRHQLNDSWALNAATSYQLFKRDYYSTERIQALANGDWVRPLGKINAEEQFYAAQVNLNGKFKTRSIEHTLLSGIDADKSFTTNFDFSFPSVTGLTAGSYDKINIFDPGKYVERTDIPEATKIRKREAPVNRFGAYIQDLIKVSPKFNVLAGIRWSYVQTVGIDSANLLNSIHSKGITRYDKAFSPRLGLVYKPLTTTSVFVSYANSFSVNAGQDIYGNSLQPSVIDQYEAGIKNDFFKGLLSANLTFYRIINNNLAQTAPYDKDGIQNSNTAIKILSGQVTSDGVELDLAGQPLQELTILAGYSHNHMRFTKTDSTKGNFIQGEKLVNNPANTANGSIFYTFSNHGLKGFKLGATAIYIGRRLGGNNNTVGQVQSTRLIPVDGYATVDLSAGYIHKRISVMAKVSNVTNTLNYYVHENYSINPIPPRQFVATVAYKF